MASIEKLQKGYEMATTTWFSNADEEEQTAQKAHTAAEQSQAMENTQEEEKTAEQPYMAKKRIVFSFRANVDDIASWRAYAIAAGRTLESVGNAAMREYLENHELAGTEKVIYQAIETKNEEEM